MKILFVGMSESIHTVRWISQIADLGWEIHLFASTNNRKIHPDFRNITIHQGFYGHQSFTHGNVKVNGVPVIVPRFASFVKNVVQTLFPQFRHQQLKNLIEKIQPDIVQSLEFQSAGYLTLDVKKRMKKFPPWIATNWGSDIYHFMKDPFHLPKIKEILINCDYYSCECQRDIKLAITLGLKGKQLPVWPNAGGFDLDRISDFKASGLSSERRLILLKGYQGWAGRALIGLKALELCENELSGYEIAIFSASPSVIKEAKKFSQSTRIKVHIIPPSTYESILQYFGKSKIYIGLSISDAISTSLLESMVMGAFPIQSNTSCADEWIDNGVSGFIVPPEDSQIISCAIKEAIKNNNLIDNAVEINYNTAKNRLKRNEIQERVIKIYKDILNSQ